MAGLKYLESSIVYGNTLYILDWDVENIEMNNSQSKTSRICDEIQVEI